MDVDGEQQGRELQALRVGEIRKKVENKNRRAFLHPVIPTAPFQESPSITDEKRSWGEVGAARGADPVSPRLTSRAASSQAPRRLPRMRVAFLKISHHSLDTPQRPAVHYKDRAFKEEAEASHRACSA